MYRTVFFLPLPSGSSVRWNDGADGMPRPPIVAAPAGSDEAMLLSATAIAATPRTRVADDGLCTGRFLSRQSEFVSAPYRERNMKNHEVLRTLRVEIFFVAATKSGCKHIRLRRRLRSPVVSLRFVPPRAVRGPEARELQSV